MPSRRFVAWQEQALWQLRAYSLRDQPITDPVWVTALIYRERAAGDLSNYLEAIADVLERARVIDNDSLIESWDGSRKLKDPANPRVELAIRPFTA